MTVRTLGQGILTVTARVMAAREELSRLLTEARLGGETALLLPLRAADRALESAAVEMTRAAGLSRDPPKGAGPPVDGPAGSGRETGGAP